MRAGAACALLIGALLAAGCDEDDADSAAQRAAATQPPSPTSGATSAATRTPGATPTVTRTATATATRTPTPAATPTATPPAAQRTEFVAREAGFRLAIPAAWQANYVVRESAGAAAARDRPRARFLVDFRFVPPPTSRASEASIVAFVVYAKADWETLSRQPGPPLGLVLAETSDLVYIAQTPQSNPYDPGSAEGMLFDRMYRALDLRNAFALR